MSLGDPLPPLPELPVGVYRHYKGRHYRVLGVARHSETLEPLVLYLALYGEGAFWVRPYADFTAQGCFDGRIQSRFTAISGESKDS